MIARAERFAIHLPVRYRLKGSIHWAESTTVNISRSGLLFRADGPLTMNAEIEIILGLPAVPTVDFGAYVLCSGHVARLAQPEASHDGTAIAAAIQQYRFVRVSPTESGLGFLC